MASVLAQQLELLDRDDFRIGKASLLYDPREAADIDLVTLYNLGLNGFDELCLLDGRFRPFAKSLFGRAGLDFNRAQAANDAVTKLDAALEAFLRLLSGYFLLPCAGKALEYLVRRYRVHENNVQGLLAALLPYHATPLFVRLLQLLQLQRTPWEFLSGVQKSGAAPPRMSLAQRAAQDGAVLTLVAGAARALARQAECSRAAVAFYAVLLAETAALAPQPSEHLARSLLPYVLEGMAREASAEHAAGAYMVAAQLAARAPPPAELQASLLDGLARCPHPALRPTALRLMALLMALGPGAELPDRALKHVARVADLPTLLASLVPLDMAGGGSYGPLVGALMRGVAARCGGHANYEALLAEFIAVLPQSAVATHVPAVVTELLAVGGLGPMAIDGADGADARVTVSRLLVVLDTRLPMALDVALNTAMAGARDGPLASRLQTFLSASLAAGSLRQPLGEGCTLGACLDHPRPHLRLAAVQQLATAAANTALDGAAAARALLAEALPRRMADDDSTVAAAALRVGLLPAVTELLPPAAVVTAAAQALGHAASATAHLQMKNSSQHSIKVGQRAARLLLQVVSRGEGVMGETLPVEIPRAVAALLEHTLVSGRSRKLQRAVVKVLSCEGAGSLFFAGFAAITVVEDTAVGDPGLASAAKLAADGALCGAVVRAVMRALAQGVGDAVGRAVWPVAALGARHLLIAALIAGMHGAAPGGALDRACGAARQVLADAIPAVEGGMGAGDGRAIWPATGSGPEWAADGTPPAAHWEALAAGGEAAYAAYARAVWRALYVFIQRTPSPAEGPNAEADGLTWAYVLLANLPAPSFSGHATAVLDRLRGALPRVLFLGQLAAAEPTGLEAEWHGVPESAQLLAIGHLKTFMEPLTAVSALAVLLAVLGGSSRRPLRAAALTCCEALSHVPVPAAGSGAHVAVAAAALARVLAEERAALVADATRLDGLLLRELGPISGSTAPIGARLKPAARTALLAALAEECVRSALSAAGRPHAAACLVRLLQHLGSTAHLLQAGGLAILSQLLAASVGGAGLTTPQEQLASQLLATALSGTRDAALASGPVWPLLLQILELPGQGSDAEASAARLRVAALACITPSLYTSLGAPQQAVLLASLLTLGARDPSPPARTAAQQALERIPVPAAALLPMLSLEGESASAPQQRTKRSHHSATTTAAVPLASGGGGALDRARAALELLQWKAVEAGGSGGVALALASPLWRLLRQLLALEENGIGLRSDDVPIEAGDAHLGRSAVGYMVNLALGALARLAAGLAGSSSAVSIDGRQWDISVAVRCLADDVAAGEMGLGGSGERREEALSLLTALAAVAPHWLVAHVLPLIGALAGAPALLRHSGRGGPLEALLSAVLPPWLAHQQPDGSSGAITQLLTLFITALPPLPAHRRLGVLTALLHCLPSSSKAEALSRSVTLLLDMHLGAGVVAGSKDDWSSDVASSLCAQAPAMLHLEALVTLLNEAMTRAGSEQLRVLRWLGKHAASGHIATAAAVAGSDVGRYLRAALSALTQAHGGSKLSQSSRVELLALVASLGEIMAPSAYVAALRVLIAGPAAGSMTQSLRQQALRLLTTRLSRRLNVLPLDPAEVSAYATLCEDLPILLASEGDHLQPALQLLDVVARVFGAQSDALLPCLLPALSAAQRPRNSPKIAAAACAAVAALLSALGPRALPLLPHAAPAVLVAAAGALTPAPTEVEDGIPVAAGALAAVEALVVSLGGFLSPVLPQLLSLLLSPALMACPAPAIAAAGQALRLSLPTRLPPRLLLAPLYATLPAAVAQDNGGGAAEAVLQLVGACASALERPAVASLHPPMFDFLLSALDSKPGTGVEIEAIAALGSLVVRLSEATFRPLFLRALEWARTPAATRSRLIAFLRLTEHLTSRLRAVFVPYFRYLLDDCIALLAPVAGDSTGTPADDGASRGKKKRRSTSGEGVGQSPTPTPMAEAWQLRVAAVSALGAIFAADTVGLVDGPLFSRLLDPLVAQIEAVGCPPNAVGAEVAALEVALIPCMGSFAVASGSDAYWKPLNRAVFMTTRSASPRSRLLGLAVARELAERLAEEYLALLPESLPFIAELLEDPEVRHLCLPAHAHGPPLPGGAWWQKISALRLRPGSSLRALSGVAVETAARALLAQLEALSGEDLEPYL